MKTENTRGLLRQLALADIRRMLLTRLALWSATAVLLWSLAILTATVTALRVETFHAILMGTASLLPAFLMFPVHRSAGEDAIRRIDAHSSVEAWLGYAGGPAQESLNTHAFETLLLGSLERWSLPRMPRSSRMAIAVLTLAALLSFAAAQVIAVRAGYGLILAYPEKPQPARNSMTREPLYDTTAAIAVPGSPIPEAEDALRDASRQAQQKPGRRNGSSLIRDPLADPGIEAGGNRENADASAETGKPAKGDSGAGQAEPRRAAAGQPPGASGQAADADKRGTGASDPTAAARAPGYEGSGRSLASSPIVEYRARFERQFTDATGKETVLGDAPGPAALSKAIAAYYESFDLKVVVSDAVDPAIATMQDGWRRAFGNGDVR
jgi:hypothetical protein